MAPDVIPSVFGSKWNDAIPVLQLLCVAGIAYSLSTANALLLLVKDKLKTLFRLTLFITVTTTVGAAAGLRWGIVGVAAGYALAQWALVVPDFWITTRSASFGLRPALRAALTPLPAALGAAVVAYGVRPGIDRVGMPAVARMFVTAAVLTIVYAALAYVSSAALRSEMRAGFERVVRRWRRRSGKTAIGHNPRVSIATEQRLRIVQKERSVSNRRDRVG